MGQVSVTLQSLVGFECFAYELRSGGIGLRARSVFPSLSFSRSYTVFPPPHALALLLRVATFSVPIFSV